MDILLMMAKIQYSLLIAMTEVILMTGQQKTVYTAHSLSQEQLPTRMLMVLTLCILLEKKALQV